MTLLTAAQQKCDKKLMFNELQRTVMDLNKIWHNFILSILS